MNYQGLVMSHPTCCQNKMASVIQQFPNNSPTLAQLLTFFLPFVQQGRENVWPTNGRHFTNTLPTPPLVGRLVDQP